jgi:hypothetical protein
MAVEVFLGDGRSLRQERDADGVLSYSLWRHAGSTRVRVESFSLDELRKLREAIDALCPPEHWSETR